MSSRPPVAPRVAQPPGKTFLEFSPDGQRMLVAGCANYARSFRTNDDGEPDMIDHVHDDTLAIACGVSNAHIPGKRASANLFRTIMPSSELKTVQSASTR